MESYKSDADNLTFNKTLDAATSSTPADMQRNESSTESRDGNIQSYIQEVQATGSELGHNDSETVEGISDFLSNQENINHCSHPEFCLFCQVFGSSTSTSLLENTHAHISANTGSGERTTDVVNSNTQTIIPENEDELGEAEVDMQDLTEQYRANEQALFELQEHICAGFRARAPFLNVNLHKYEAANSTSLESKDHCCICLDEYFDGEEIARIDCGHLYHIGCIREWNELKKTCPICNRRVCVLSYASMRIRAVLDFLAPTNHLSSGSAN